MANNRKIVAREVHRTSGYNATVPFSPDSIKELLRSGIIKGSTRMPNDASLAKLSRELADLKTLSKTVSHELGLVRLAAELLPAIDLIVRKAPALAAQFKGFPEFFPDYELLMSLSDAASAVLEQKPLVIALAQSEFRSVDRWETILEVVVRVFMEAISSTNPKVWLSHSGPVAARFAVAVIPAITGETPTLDAVAQRLKRNALSEREGRDISGLRMSRDKTIA